MAQMALGPTIDASKLRDTLVLLAAEQKKFYLMLSAALNELAAVRETVRGLDPTFSDVLEKRQPNLAEKSAEVHAAQVNILNGLYKTASEVVYYL